MQFGISQLGLIRNQRDRVRGAGCFRRGGFEHRDHRGGRRCDKFAVRLRQDAGPVARTKHVQAGETAVGRSQRVVQQLYIVSQHLVDERGAQLCLVLEFDERRPRVEHNRKGERQMRGYRAQFELSHGDAVQRESTGALAHAEAQTDELVHAVVSDALRVHFAHHSIDAHGLVGEAVEAGFARRVDERVEGVLRSRGDPQQQRVAEVPDGALGGSPTLGDRH